MKAASAPVATPIPTLQPASSRVGKRASSRRTMASWSEDSRIQGSAPAATSSSSRTVALLFGSLSAVSSPARSDRAAAEISGRCAMRVAFPFSRAIMVIAG